MIVPALEHSAASIGVDISYDWVPCDRIDESVIRSADGLFIGPGGPSENIEAILRAIRWARLQLIPCLGTCGGFQRIVTEYAINELGIDRIVHEEVSPDAVDPFFAGTVCSLVGEESGVEFVPGSMVSKIYGATRITESSFCAYGISAKYVERFQGGRMRISGLDATGNARVIELTDHPFFMGTLYVPQVRSTESQPHPIITAFVNAVKEKGAEETRRSQAVDQEQTIRLGRVK